MPPEAASDVAKNTQSSVHEIEQGAGQLKPGARSAFKNDDLFADGQNSHHSKQQTGRTPGRDQSICRDRRDASRRSQPHASRRGRERK